MDRTMMKGKIHRATVTDANLAYEGSITLDPVLMELADILPHEQVHVYDVDNGNRLITYAIEGERGAGGVCLNGAAARLVQPGDTVIIVSYAEMADAEARAWTPKVVRVDERNRPLPNMLAEKAS
jgi:aspartate 1-decarboxylase